MEGNNRRHCTSVINPNNLVTERLATSQIFLLVLLLPFKTYPLKSHYRVPRNPKLAVSTPARPLLPIQPTLFYLAPMTDTLEKLSSNPPRHITKEEAALTSLGILTPYKNTEHPSGLVRETKSYQSPLNY